METIKKVKCNRCGYVWYPRKPEMPNNCANKKCNSPYWNKPRVYNIKPKEKPEH